MNLENLKISNSKDENVSKKEKKKFLTLEEMFIERGERPAIKYLFAGVKEKTFGIVFGPSKSGKTIYCENLAMSLAIGRKDFIGHKLDGVPKKILFVSLEEFWINRVDRNKKQILELSDDEVELVKSNYMYQKIEFEKYILEDEHWELLEQMILDSKAEIVFLDSLTRMSPGEMEKSRDAGKVIKRLRDLCYSNSITLIVIHHSRKGIDQRLTLDSIRGSAVFAQETDFAIGVAKTSKNDRYIKHVYYRYASDNEDFVKSFNINENTWISNIKDEYEDKLISVADSRFVENKTDYLEDYLNENSKKTYTTSELVEYFTTLTTHSERKIKYDLKTLEKKNLLIKVSRGNYKALETTKNDEDESL